MFSHARTRACWLLVIVALVSTAFFSGCNPSDTITQIIYDQNPENEMDETQTLLVNDPNATQTSDSLPKMESAEDDSRQQDTIADLPHYGGDTSQALVAKPVEESVEENLDAAADEPSADNVTNVSAGESAMSDNNPGEDGDDGKREKKSDTSDSGKPKAEFESDSDGLEDTENVPESSESKMDDESGATQNEEGDNPDVQGDNQSEVGKGKNAKNKVKVYKDYGDDPEIPVDIKHVTAVGDAAVIVSMLGGTKEETPLLGADADLLENAEVQEVLANKGISQVAKVWDNDGTANGDLADVKDIIDLDPELCFVTEGDETLTKDQQDALLEANIIVYTLPSMASSAKITYAVQLVGDILKEGGNEQAGKLADDYTRFHNDLVTSIANANGGVTGGFDYSTGRDIATNATPLYSLYISDWDYDARYDDKTGFLKTPEGVGIADIGYENHPVSYYMSVGGVSNTASTSVFRVLSGKSAPVWQFSLTQMPCTWSNWKKINRRKASYELKGDGFERTLLWANDGNGCGLGTERFPGVIVATQEMKIAMEAEAIRDGAYYPYPVASNSRGGVASSTMVGFYNGSNLIAACIGTEGSGLRSFLNDGSGKVGTYDIHVNPHGLFSSWTDGSVESVLEAAWIYKTFRNEDYDLNKIVKDFYQDFYDYDLGDQLSTVLAGKEK